MTFLQGLLSPFRLRNLQLRNRIVMAPMTREMSPSGVPGADVAQYYARRAAAGVGLIITEGVGIGHPASVDKPSIPLMFGKNPLHGWRGVVTAVHAAGGLIAPQLWHQGVMRDPQVSAAPHVHGVRPSGVWGPAGGTASLDRDYVERVLPATQPMTETEILDVIAAFRQAALVAREIGFDAIALHGAHGYLIDSFLWHETNRRGDRWGGEPAGRARFAVEVVRAIRDVAADLPVIFRFSQFKLQDYKARLAETPDELGDLLRPIAEAGVDLFDGSQRYFDTPIFKNSPLNLAGWAKRLTGVASMTVGGVGLDQGGGRVHIDAGSSAVNNLPRLAERFAAGEFDLVGVGRSLLNDPLWLRKAIAGEAFLPFDAENLTRLT